MKDGRARCLYEEADPATRTARAKQLGNDGNFNPSVIAPGQARVPGIGLIPSCRPAQGPIAGAA